MVDSLPVQVTGGQGVYVPVLKDTSFSILSLEVIMTKKLCYKVGTHVGTEYAYAYTVRQALWLVFQRLKGRGSRLSWQQCYDGWTIAPA